MFVHDGLNKCSLQGVNVVATASHKATLACVVVTAFKNMLIAKYLHSREITLLDIAHDCKYTCICKYEL